VLLKILIGLVGGLFTFLILGVMLDKPNDPNDPKRLDRSAIAVCWSEQSKKSLDPATARAIAGACEKAEAEFKTKYGVSP
jgi:hypothetical protein